MGSGHGTCPDCGWTSDQADARFCARCGAVVDLALGRASGSRRVTAWLVTAVVVLGGVLFTAWSFTSVGDVEDGDSIPSGVVPDQEGPDETLAELGLGEDWTQQLPDSRWVGVVDRPVVTDTSVHVTAEGVLYAISAVDGAVEWRYEARDAVVEVVATDELVVAGTTAGLVGLDPADGTVSWATTTDSRDRWDQLMYADEVVVGVLSRGTPTGIRTVVSAFDVEGGTLWEHEFNDWVGGEATILETKVVVPTFSGFEEGTVRALDLHEGRQWWEAEVAGPASTAVWDGEVFAVSRREIVAVDSDRDGHRWHTPLDLEDGAAPSVEVADGRLWVLTTDPGPVTVAIVDASDGQLQHRLELSAFGSPQATGLALEASAVVGDVSGSDATVMRGATVDDETLWEQPLNAERIWHVVAGPLHGEGDGGRLVATTSAGEVVALDPHSGEIMWRTLVAGATAPKSAPLVTSEGSVAVVGGEPRVLRDHARRAWVITHQGEDLTAVDVVNGEMLWQRSGVEAAATRSISPSGSIFVPDQRDAARRLLELSPDGGSVVAEVGLDTRIRVNAVTTVAGYVYVVGSSGLVAVDPDHRRVRWTTRTDEPLTTVVGDTRILAAVDEQGAIHTFDPADGTPLWSASAHSCTAPALVDGVAAVGTEEGIVAFDLATGERRWQRDTSPTGCVALDATSGLLFQTDMVSLVEAIDPSDGTRVWARTVDHALAAPLAAAGGFVALPDATGTVYRLDARTGEDVGDLVLGAPAGSAPLLFSDGMVVIDRAGTWYGHTYAATRQ